MVPCGKCKMCTMLKRREWTLRMMNELEYHDESTFLTLTYDDNHLPDNQSLSKVEMQNWQKNLRHLVDKKIKFYTIGEYGSNTFRPHYHSIIFGLSPDDEKLFYRSWHKGFLYFGNVNHDSVQYVAGYVQKKLYGNLADEMYTLNGLLPPFSLMSKGIGLRWAKNNQDRIAQDMDIKIFNKSYGIPRYYVKKLGLEHSNELLKISLKEKQKRLDELRKQGIESEYLAAVEKRLRLQRKYDCESFPMHKDRLS